MPRHVLLTNDDGLDSPLLALLIAALRPLANVTVAIPTDEQSWQGKSMTRVGEIRAEPIELAGAGGFAITGTPADCVNLALHNLVNEPVDAVISGINIGRNTGLGFMLSSGTVGGCIEGNIAGIPGLALSQEFERDDFRYWATHRQFRPETIEHLRSQCAAVIPAVWAALDMAQIAEAVTWSVNFPYRVADTALERTYLGYSFYRRCFQPTADGTYVHQVEPFPLDEDPRSDSAVIKAGKISATRIDIRTLGAPTES
ncbi:MAG: 5'/3'-nucleotidase SurE [Pseudomonadota bacterium]